MNLDELLMTQPALLAAAALTVAASTLVGLRAAHAAGVELARLTFGMDES